MADKEKERKRVTALRSKRSLSVKKEVSDINACVERCVEILISLCFSPYEHQSLTNKSQIKTFSEEYIKAGALDNFEYIKNFNALKT